MEHDFSALFSTAYTFIGWLLMFVIVWFVTRTKGINLSNSIVHAGPRLKKITKISRAIESELSNDGSFNVRAVKRRLYRIHKWQRSVVRILDLYLFENPSDLDTKEIRALVSEIGSKVEYSNDKAVLKDNVHDIDRISLDCQSMLEGIISKYKRK